MIQQHIKLLSVYFILPKLYNNEFVVNIISPALKHKPNKDKSKFYKSLKLMEVMMMEEQKSRKIYNSLECSADKECL